MVSRLRLPQPSRRRSSNAKRFIGARRRRAIAIAAATRSLRAEASAADGKPTARKLGAGPLGVLRASSGVSQEILRSVEVGAAVDVHHLAVDVGGLVGG